MIAPGYEQLAAMPGLLRSVTAGMSNEEARWKVDPGRWSTLEVLEHLVHVEAHGFRGRAARILAEDEPLLPNYDPDALMRAGSCTQPDLATALDEFERARTLSLHLLQQLQPGQFARAATHSTLGRVTLGDLLHEWPFHDLGHLRQIAEIVRAVRFHPHMGPWRQFYTVRP